MLDGPGTVRAWFDAMSREDTAGMLALMAPDVLLVPARGAGRGRYEGHDGVARFLEQTREQFGDVAWHCRIDSVEELPDGRTVCAGRNIGLEIDFVALHEFAIDGRIALARHFYGSDLETLKLIGRV